ncbi:MAG: hypothetical protein ACTSVB_11665 [Candidatus Heimdallarchaeaceae archaeon]
MNIVAKEEHDIIAELKGTALRIFLFLLKNNEIGIRDAQRKLGLKSASHVQYHLQRFEHLGIVEKMVNSRYCLTPKYSELRSIKLGLLTEIYIYKGAIIPSIGFFSGALFTILIFSLIFYFQVSKLSGFIICLISVFSTAVYFLIQAIQILKNFSENEDNHKV